MTQTGVIKFCSQEKIMSVVFLVILCINCKSINENKFSWQMKHLFRYRCDRNLSKLAEKMLQNCLKSERVSSVCCQFLPSPIIAFIFIFLTDEKVSHDVWIPHENFANRHIVFTDFNHDVLCSQQQQQRQNKCKPGKFICAFFPNFSS